MDLHVKVPPVKFREIASDKTEKTLAKIRARVSTARPRQQARLANEPTLTCKARIGPQELVKLAMMELNLRVQAYERFLKVARTIADLTDPEIISRDHISEAIQYRSRDRQL